MSKLREVMESIDINLSEKQEEKFEKFKQLIEEGNEKIDITNIVGDDIYVKHFADSLTALKSDVIKSNVKLIDIGTGGGFPGIPLKIFDESLKVDLLDSLNKRLIFLDQVIKELEFVDIKTIHARAEELSRTSDYRERYDIAISRAVANFRTLLEYCLPFVKKGGYFISMKGPGGLDELKDAKNAIELLGGKVDKVIEFDLEDNRRTILVIKKIKITDQKYPRGQGKPRKNPL